MAEVRKFEVVQDEPDTPPRIPIGEKFATDALMLALKGLSQRAIIAVDNLFTLLTVGSAFWLWLSIPSPSTYQLIGLAMYAVFVLAANWIVRRK